MTGFAKKQTEVNGKQFTIEIKTLNSKQMDANVKLPSAYRSKELEIRALLNKLERGKIDLVLSQQGDNGGFSLNEELIRSRFESLRNVSNTVSSLISDDTLMQSVLRHDDIWNNDDNNEPATREWEEVSRLVSDCIDDVDATRTHEGMILREDFLLHLSQIEQRLAAIPSYEKERIDTIRERLRTNFKEENIAEADANRFEQEIIYYLEKLDITEEKVRLAKHLAYFREVMDNEPSCGKKLTFIAQEMGREINTTGSKANHVEIQRLVVEMKDELEKIKEQLGNIL